MPSKIILPAVGMVGMDPARNSQKDLDLNPDSGANSLDNLGKIFKSPLSSVLCTGFLSSVSSRLLVSKVPRTIQSRL